jgi:hypothetical protein
MRLAPAPKDKIAESPSDRGAGSAQSGVPKIAITAATAWLQERRMNDVESGRMTRRIETWDLDRSRLVDLYGSGAVLLSKIGFPPARPR